MLKVFLFFSTCYPQDSLVQDSVSLQPSILLIKKKDVGEVATYKYEHQQGFFCDFEDYISKNKRVFLNLGVGNQ